MGLFSNPAPKPARKPTAAAKTTGRKKPAKAAEREVIVHKPRPGAVAAGKAYRAARAEYEALERKVERAQSSGALRRSDPQLTEMMRQRNEAYRRLGEM